MQRHATLALMFMMFAGCAVYNRTQAPDLATPAASVTGVRLVEQTEEGALLEITIGVENPNDVALPLSAASFSVDVAGASGTFTGKPNRTLPAGGSQTVTLNAALATTASVSGAAVSVRGTITYVPPGEIRQLMTETYIPLPSAPFTYGGSVQ